MNIVAAIKVLDTALTTITAANELVNHVERIVSEARAKGEVLTAEQQAVLDRIPEIRKKIGL